MRTYKPQQLLPSAADASKWSAPSMRESDQAMKRFQSLALCGLAWTPFALSPLCPKPKGTVKNVSNALADIRGYRPLRFCILKHTIGVIKDNV